MRIWKSRYNIAVAIVFFVFIVLATYYSLYYVVLKYENKEKSIINNRRDCIWILSYTPIPDYNIFDHMHLQEKLIKLLDRDRKKIAVAPYPLWVNGVLYHLTRCRDRGESAKDLLATDGFLVSAVSKDILYNALNGSYIRKDVVNSIARYIDKVKIYEPKYVTRHIMMYVDMENYSNSINDIISRMVDSENLLSFLNLKSKIVDLQEYIVCRNENPPFYRGLVLLRGRKKDFERVWETALSRLRKNLQYTNDIWRFLQIDAVNHEIYLGNSGIVLYRKGHQIRVKLFGVIKDGALESCDSYQNAGYLLAEREEVWHELGGGLTESALQELVKTVLALWRTPEKMVSGSQELVTLPVSITCKSSSGRDEIKVTSNYELMDVVRYLKSRDPYFQFLSSSQESDIIPYICYIRQCRKGVQLWPKDFEKSANFLLRASLVVDVAGAEAERNGAEGQRLAFRDWRTTAPCSEINKY